MTQRKVRASAPPGVWAREYAAESRLSVDWEVYRGAALVCFFDERNTDMQTFYANGILWTRWASIYDAPVTVVLPLPDAPATPIEAKR